jgi:hypothetical protein
MSPVDAEAAGMILGVAVAMVRLAIARQRPSFFDFSRLLLHLDRAR